MYIVYYCTQHYTFILSIHDVFTNAKMPYANEDGIVDTKLASDAPELSNKCTPLAF